MTFDTVGVLLWIKARLLEPSTYAGGGILALVIEGAFPGAMGSEIMTLLATAAGIASILLKEKATRVVIQPVIMKKPLVD
jgi:hypothetical protein